MGHVERNAVKVGGRFFLFVLTFALVVPTHATAAVDDCLLGFSGVAAANPNGGSLTCEDCDPMCDGDGGPTANGSCTFALKVCANPSSSACTAAGATLQA